MLGVTLNRDGELSLSRQIYQQVRESILAGRLKGGQLLPSTRSMARALSVSRNVLVEAYDLLLTEGFIESRQGAASRVVPNLDIGPPNPAEPHRDKPELPVRIDFRTGRPDLKAFPKYLWGRILSQAFTNLPAGELGYRRPAGYPPLREEIAAWLHRQRGLVASPDDIFICAGATAGLFLLADLLFRERPFAVENPSHPGFQAVLNLKGYPIRWTPADENGLDVSALNPGALSAVYVTPSHQFPLGGIMDAARRAALIRLARAHDFFIIEDDYDSEFRYHGPPISPLYSLDPARVMYVGTFSKTMFPALRIGFVILPPSWRESWLTRRKFFDIRSPALEEAALAEFMRQGKLDRHVRDMRRRYAEKRAVLLAALEESFKGRARPLGEAAGLHVAVQIEGVVFDEKFVNRCLAVGVRATPLAHYCPNTIGHRDKLLLGYGHLSPDEIRLGMKLVAEQV